MPRPQKKGLDYFPLDVDFLSDRKIKILKSRYGADGITLYIYLLCEIYRNGYYLKVDDDFYFLIADDLGMERNKVQQVLRFLLERSLFDSTLFQSDTVLTSAGIQRRFQLAVKERARKTPVIVERFWLLSKEETETFIKVRHCPYSSGKNEDSSGKNEDSSGNHDIKKSKVRKSKVKNNNAEQQTETYFHDTELNRLFTVYLAEREKAEKRSLSQERIRMLCEELTAMASDDTERIEIVKKAIASGWKSFYPIKKAETGKQATKGSNRFNNFHQREYDMAELERELLKN